TEKEYRQIHFWLKKSFGKANKCESFDCRKISNIFEWALKKGFRHEFKKENYVQLCRSCHRRYDMTNQKKEQANKNFSPTRGQRKGVILSISTRNKISLHR